jgi:protein-S-isoprenylcysteine O-methyltransferase Ste14
MFWIVTALLALFAVLHSWLAGSGIKAAVRQRIGEQAYEAYYRLGYNIWSIVTLLPVVIALLLNPGRAIWQTEGFVSILFLVVQALGLVGMLISLMQIDLLRFGGLRQVLAYWNGQRLPLPDEPLQVNGVYRLVRHPLYLFSLMIIWPLNIMNEGILAFAIGSTIYFIFGSLLEERRLLEAYGETYRLYQQQTPWLIPLPRFNSKLRI